MIPLRDPNDWSEQADNFSFTGCIAFVIAFVFVIACTIEYCTRKPEVVQDDKLTKEMLDSAYDFNTHYEDSDACGISSWTEPVRVNQWWNGYKTVTLKDGTKLYQIPGPPEWADSIVNDAKIQAANRYSSLVNKIINKQ